MPKISEIFSARFFKAEHLNGKSRVLVIEGWEQEEAYGEQQYVLYFEDERRALRLNATNAKDIAELHGDVMEKWTGEKVELYPTQKEITDKETKKKKTIDMIRVRAPASSSTPVSPATKSIPAKPHFDDDIPF
jgi:hypothetical protein